MINTTKNQQQKNDLLIEKLVFYGNTFPKEKREKAVSLAVAEFKNLTGRSPDELFSEIYMKVLRKLNKND